MNVGIVGLGLMGGSFAKAIKKYNVCDTIVGYDHNKKHELEAINLGLVDEIVSLNRLKQCDIIILCIPVDAIIELLKSMIDISCNTTIIDFGSTKELIVNNIPKQIKANFVPAHPMTGTEKFGPLAAVDNLYENKTVVLCEIDKCAKMHKTRAIKIFEKINMNIVYLNAYEHDIHTSYISHLPHAISYALANTVMQHEDPKHIISLASGGFKDMSRIAKSSPNMWIDIFKQNRENILESVALFQEQIDGFQQALKDERYDEITNWMLKANSLHDILK